MSMYILTGYNSETDTPWCDVFSDKAEAAQEFNEAVEGYNLEFGEQTRQTELISEEMVTYAWFKTNTQVLLAQIAMFTRSDVEAKY